MSPRGRLYLLVICALVLGAVVGVELALGPPRFAVADTAAAISAGPASPPRTRQDASVDKALAEVLARPLLSPTRRPAVGSAGAGNTGDAGLAGARLTAIVIAPDRRLAVFAVPGGKSLELGEGDTLDGRRIETIALHEVSLIGPDGTKTLQPKPDPTLVPAGSPQTAAAAAAAAPGSARPLPLARPPVPQAPPGGPVKPPRPGPGPSR